MPMNKVILCGYLGQDPELKYLQSGNAVTTLSVATPEKWKDKNGQKQEKTEWHRVVVYGRIAEACGQYLSKGQQALVEGKLQTRSWDDKNGEKRYLTEILASNVQFIGTSGKGNGQNQNQNQNQNYQNNNQQNNYQNSNNTNQYRQNPDTNNYAPSDIPF